MEKWEIHKATKSEKGGGVLEVLMETKPMLQALKASQCLFDDNVFKATPLTHSQPEWRPVVGSQIRSNGKSLVKIRPKAKSDTNTYVVTFTDACTVRGGRGGRGREGRAELKDPEVRAIGIGFALLLTMSIAYEELRNILSESLSQE